MNITINIGFTLPTVSDSLYLSFKILPVGLCVVRYNLLRHSNLGPTPIFHRFRDIAGFGLLNPPLFHPNFGVVPVASDRPCWGQCEQVP